MYYRRNHWFPSSLRFKWVKICKALTVPPKLVLFYPFHPYHHLYYELPIHQVLPPLLSARPFLAKTGNIYDPLHGYLRASAFFFFNTIPGINCHRALAGHLLSFLPDFPPFLPHQGGQSLGLLLFQFSLIVPKTEGWWWLAASADFWVAYCL